MRNFIQEVDSNFATFSVKWKTEQAANIAATSVFSAVFASSYRRLVSLQAWRSSLLEHKLSAESLAFFIEAQNDALISHTQIQIGSWRTALIALRSCIENIINCVYYKDHPVEYLLWDASKFRLGFTAGMTYLKGHPALNGISNQLCGIETLEKEYATLSKAVHASAKGFRMTDGQNKTCLWNISRATINSWSTRENNTIIAVNTLLLCLFKSELQGARLSGLRQAISLSIPLKNHAVIKSDLGVSLQDPASH